MAQRRSSESTCDMCNKEANWRCPGCDIKLCEEHYGEYREFLNSKVLRLELNQQGELVDTSHTVVVHSFERCSPSTSSRSENERIDRRLQEIARIQLTINATESKVMKEELEQEQTKLIQEVDSLLVAEGYI